MNDFILNDDQTWILNTSTQNDGSEWNEDMGEW